MNNIKILYSIWNNPRIDSLPLQRTSERHVFTRTHMNTLHFKNCHKCQSDYSLDRVPPFDIRCPIWIDAFIIFSPKSLQSIQAQERTCSALAISTWRGCWRDAPHLSQQSVHWSPLRRTISRLLTTRITRAGQISVEALPPGPFCKFTYS